MLELENIEGVGPKTKELLNSKGIVIDEHIKTVDQLAMQIAKKVKKHG